VPSRALSAVDLRSLEHLLLYPLFDASVAGSDLTYRPVASLAVVSRSLPDDGSAVGVVDIVRNRRRAFAVSGGDVTPSFEASVASGTWESYAEELILGPGHATFSAARSVRAARDSNLEIVTLKPHELEKVVDLALSGAAKTNLLADLASGFVVAVPRRTPPGFEGRVGWWRVDPLSGETLAVGDDGRGVVLTETEESIIAILSRILWFGTLFGFIAYNIMSQAVERVIDCVAFDLSHGHRQRGVVERTASRCLSSGSTR
jgi:hypothetical protein